VEKVDNVVIGAGVVGLAVLFRARPTDLMPIERVDTVVIGAGVVGLVSFFAPGQQT